MMSPECALLNEERLTKSAILSRIPAFPPVVLQALDLLATEDTELPELVRVIVSDATLAAQVLRLANSALFSFPTEIFTVSHAVTAMGLARVQSLILTLATTNYMRAALGTQALGKCWSHTLAAAILSRELARAAGLEPERTYSAGLLHDIGRLGLLVAYPGPYDSLVATAGRDAVSLLDLEKRRFGMDHCEAGRLLMAEWGLPPAVSVAAGRHHDPPQGGPFDMLHAVYFACRLADTLGYFVTAPLQAATYEEVIEELPAGVREAFSQQAETARKAVDHAIGEGQISGPASYHPAAREIAEEATTGASHVEPRWAGWRDRLFTRDRVVLLAAAGLFAALLMGLVYLSKG